MLSLYTVLVAIATGAAITIAVLCEGHRQKLLTDIACDDDGGMTTARSKVGIDSPVPSAPDMLAVGEPWSDTGVLNSCRRVSVYFGNISRAADDGKIPPS